MRTGIETQTNIQSWIENKRLNPVDKTKNQINNSLLSAVEKWEIFKRKAIERETINKETLDSTKPLTNETHFIVEAELAKMFGIKNEKVSRLREDFEEPMNLAWVLSLAENYWEKA